MTVNKVTKYLGVIVTLIALLLGFFFTWESDLFHRLTALVSPTPEEDVRSGDMGYRRKPKTLDQLEDQEEAEMISFLDRELEVQRDIAGSITVELEAKDKKEDPESVKNDPLQVQMIKKSAKKSP